jgi:hypothetical protein
MTATTPVGLGRLRNASTLTAANETAKLVEEQTRREFESLKEQKALLLKLEKSWEEQKKDLKEAWEKQKKGWEEHEKVLNEAWEGEKRTVAELKLHLIIEKSRSNALLTMRPLVENALRMWSKGESKNITQLSTDFVEEILLENGKFTQQVKQWLVALEGATVDEAAVKRELKQIYHQLSKDHHYPPLRNRTGLICGGEFPLRTATALLLLALQQEKCLVAEIQYTDASFDTLRLLQNGSVVH